MAINPLADRMRPTSFDEIAGQSHLVGENGILRKLVENNRIAKSEMREFMLARQAQKK